MQKVNEIFEKEKAINNYNIFQIKEWLKNKEYEKIPLHEKTFFINQELSELIVLRKNIVSLRAVLTNVKKINENYSFKHMDKFFRDEFQCSKIELENFCSEKLDRLNQKYNSILKDFDARVKRSIDKHVRYQNYMKRMKPLFSTGETVYVLSHNFLDDIRNQKYKLIVKATIISFQIQENKKIYWISGDGTLETVREESEIYRTKEECIKKSKHIIDSVVELAGKETLEKVKELSNLKEYLKTVGAKI